MAKKSFLMYTSWGTLLDNLDDEKAGQLMKAVFAYERGEDVEVEDPVLSAVFQVIKAEIDENNAKYQERCEKNRQIALEREENKRIRSNTNVHERTRTYTNSTDNDIDNDLNKKENTSKDVKEKKHYHGEKVLLTDKEYEKLKADYGEEKTEKAIAYLNDYIVEKQYKSKSHNLALRRWVFDAVEEQDQRREKMKAPRSGTTKFNQFEQRKYDYDALEKMLLGGSGA